jgi:hypothetical protein
MLLVVCVACVRCVSCAYLGFELFCHGDQHVLRAQHLAFEVHLAKEEKEEGWFSTHQLPRAHTLEQPGKSDWWPHLGVVGLRGNDLEDLGYGLLLECCGSGSANDEAHIRPAKRGKWQRWVPWAGRQTKRASRTWCR